VRHRPREVVNLLNRAPAKKDVKVSILNDGTVVDTILLLPAGTVVLHFKASNAVVSNVLMQPAGPITFLLFHPCSTTSNQKAANDDEVVSRKSLRISNSAALASNSEIPMYIKTNSLCDSNTNSRICLH